MMLASRNADGGIDLRSPHFRYGLRGFFGTGLGKVVEGGIIPDRYHLPDGGITAAEGSPFVFQQVCQADSAMT